MRVILTVVTLLILTACATGNQNSISNDKGFDVVSKDSNSKKRVALVIGNKDYQQPFTRLNNTINDARAMKNILETRGFKVIYKTDVTRRGFEESLEKFYRELGASDIGLLYFSGHGLEYDGQNYLIPTDSNIKAKTDTKYEAIALNKVTERMKLENDKLNIVILDACRNDPFAKAMGVGGLAETNPPVGLFVSYATGAGEVSSDGRIGENGLFTKYLIKYIQEPLSFRDVFQKAKEAVYMASNKKQLPAIYNNTINVNFYFTLPSIKHSNTITPVANISNKNYEFTEKDLPEVINCEEIPSNNSIKSCEKTIFFLTNIKGKNISLKGQLSGAYKGEKYAISWIKTNENYRIGCLYNPNESKFDNFKLKDYVKMTGKIHHIEKHSYWKFPSLILARGCEMQSIQ